MEGEIKVRTLNEIAEKYLQKNGITIKFFADYIGCEFTKCSRWLKGERKLNPQQIRKTHEFLQGNFLKSVDEIIKGE